MVENDTSFDIKKALNNLKSFRKGFEKSCGKHCDVIYINYLPHGKFLESYSRANPEDRMGSYSFKDSNTLYVDLSCLLNCNAKEAYMMGACAISANLVVAKS
ncbi:MAG: hypothetical protein M1544_02805 [Candidatus Marsarchaeota archaeon]|nr:hypothetical protein [Candidatus Marsarchaeota archaeon]